MRLRWIPILFFAVAYRSLGDECVTGPKTTVDEVLIVFKGCPQPASAEVRWFNRLGNYKDFFTFPATRQLKYPFSPRVIMMTSDLGSGCITGDYVQQPDGRCIARYEFLCAERQYSLAVATDPPVEYAIQRAINVIGKPGLICSQPIGPPANAVGALAAGERVIVSLYGAEDKNFPLVTLPAIDLASAPPEGHSKTYKADDLRRLIAERVRGQGGSGASPNAETIGTHQKKNVLKSVTVAVKKAKQ
ncbi:MAG: hypothetical protein AABO58_19335 [Acidobacteriota bacterium]